jgi:voltage-gated potassium channel
VNPFDRFGDHLRLALHAPASYQLMSWLVNGPGAALPERGQAPATGRWVMCGHGRFGQELTADLRAEGLEVTIIDLDPGAGAETDAVADTGADAEPGIIVGDASDPAVIARADLEQAVGLVAGTDNDTTNLSLIAAARKINPSLFIAARQNRPASAPLFAAVEVDWLLVPTEVMAREIYAQLSTPLLWRFLRDMLTQDDDWAAHLVDRLRRQCGSHLSRVWKVTLTGREAPALGSWLRGGDARIGDLLRSPQDRERQLDAVPLLLSRHSGGSVLTPGDDITVAPEDQILFAGRPAAQRHLIDTMTNDAVSEYVLRGRSVPSGWLWQRLTHRIPHSGQQ